LWGPRHFGLRGTPRREPVWDHLTDTAVAARLWDASRALTGTDLDGRGFKASRCTALR
jgi:hypothetical protein